MLSAIVFSALLLSGSGPYATNARVSISAMQSSLDLNKGLEEWYLPTTDNKCKLYVLEMGKGEPVIVVHGGFGAEHGYLVPPLKPLTEKHRLIFYDQRGSLRSPCDPSSISVDKHVEDLEQLRQELGVDKVVILAHSMGTFIASSYLQKHPEHVKGLVLIGLVRVKTPVTEADRQLTKQHDQRFQAFVQRPGFHEELKKWNVDKPENQLSPRERSRQWRISFANGNTYHVERWQEMAGGQVFYSATSGSAAARSMPKEYDFTKAYAQQTFPITVINGDHDLVDMGNDMCTTWLRGIKNVELVILRDSGHNSWIDQPKEFLAQVRRALAKVATDVLTN